MAGFDRDQPARHADATGVGGGVKVVEKWRFENPAGVSLERSNSAMSV